MGGELDAVRLHLSDQSLLILQICLGLVMFGVALDLRISYFRLLFRSPRSVWVGFASQFLLLPALTFLLVYLWQPHPSLALGMIIVAACPGGNVSNFFSWWGRGDVALSVTLTAIATLGAILLTPLNFTAWSTLNPQTSELVREVSVYPLDMVKTVGLLLGIPLMAGMALRRFNPQLANRMQGYFKIFSLLFFAAFIALVFWANRDHFVDYIDEVFVLVLVHNAVALLAGYTWARTWQLDLPKIRSITIETGIQNSGLALVLIFQFFPEFGGMALIAAWWGIWHLVAGLAVAGWWSRKSIQTALR